MFGLGAGEICSLTSALIWATAVILFRKCGESVPPVALNLFKDAIALALFLVTLPILGIPLAPANATLQDWVLLLASGAIGIGIADSIFFASLNRLGAMGSAVVDCLYSPCVVIAAFAILGEPLRLPLVAGVGLMIGAILLATSASPHIEQAPDRRTITTGVALGALAMALMAVGIVIAKPALDHTDVWWATTVRLMGGTGFLAIQCLAPANRRAFVACCKPSRAWRFTIPAAVIGAYIAMVIWVMGFKLTSAGVAGVLNQTSSIFVLILAALFLGERVTTRKAAGIATAVAGAVVVVL